MTRPPFMSSAVETRSPTVIVHGPKACGKTRNRLLLAAYFGCSVIVDDWRTCRPTRHSPQSLTPGALHLTYRDPSGDSDLGAAMILRFDDALSLAATTGEIVRIGGEIGVRVPIRGGAA